jgi:hypothetical protein
VARKTSCTSVRISDAVSERDHVTESARELTGLVKHLITLVENEDADAAQAEGLVPNESLEAARGANNDVRASVLVLQRLHILLDGGTAVENTRLNIRHVFAEAVVLIANLVGQLTGVAHDHNRDLAIHWLNLLQSRQDEDGSLSQTGLGLADNVTTEEGLRNASLLNCRSRGR